MFTAIILVATLALDPAPQTGPIYDLLDAYRAEQPEAPGDQLRWANAMLDALDANPSEEWSTRIRAYEEAGSIFWRNGDYESAAPIFLSQWQESEQRADNGEAVRSLDNLINLYGEANFPAQDQLDFYDATETWLGDPPPGQEARYGEMLNQLYGERAMRLRNFAEQANSEAERRAYLDEAAYYEQLQNGSAQPTHIRTKTLHDIAQSWFAKSKRPAKQVVAQNVPAKPVVSPVQSPTSPPVPVVAPPPPFEPAARDTPAKPSAPTAQKMERSPGVSSEVVIGICLGVIILGWIAAAFVYLRRGK